VADVLRLSRKPQIARMDVICANEIFLFSKTKSLSPRRPVNGIFDRPGSRSHFLDSGLRRNDTSWVFSPVTPAKAGAHLLRHKGVGARLRGHDRLFPSFGTASKSLGHQSALTLHQNRQRKPI
jgi:hypothetical protein